MKGANVMGANFLMFISGEFIDASISALTIGALRIVYVEV